MVYLWPSFDETLTFSPFQEMDLRDSEAKTVISVDVSRSPSRLS